MKKKNDERWPMIWAYLLGAALTLWEENLEIVPIHRSGDKRAWPSFVDGSGFVYDDEAGGAPLTCSVGILGESCPYTMVVASGFRKQ